MNGEYQDSTECDGDLIRLLVFGLWFLVLVLWICIVVERTKIKDQNHKAQSRRPKAILLYSSADARLRHRSW
jgi:hypothetical protein